MNPGIQPSTVEDLRRRAALCQERMEQQRAAPSPHWPSIAHLCYDLANIYRALTDYPQVIACQDQAIEAYRRAIADLELEDKGSEWAALQAWLGGVYCERMGGDRAENVERAIGHFALALEMYTREAFPRHWAMVQDSLETLHRQRWTQRSGIVRFFRNLFGH